MKSYQTFWKQGAKHGVYKTKSLTQFHKDIHNNPITDYARTVETDSSVDFPFGLYSEIIAITNRANPKNNQPFEN